MSLVHKLGQFWKTLRVDVDTEYIAAFRVNFIEGEVVVEEGNT
jgi:hypothetical protein